MKRLYDTYTIYEFSDECIVKEICKRVKSIRLSCCFSQQEFADKAGVSIVTIKRIESCKVSDIALSTLLKILRISGTLEGVVGLVPELPDSPFLVEDGSTMLEVAISLIFCHNKLILIFFLE